MLSLGKHGHIFMHYASKLGVRQTVELQLKRLLGTRTPMSLRVDGISNPVLCRPHDSDRISLSQVLIERDSEVSLAFSPKLIIDGGANVGYASVLFANLYPKATILAVEPDDKNLEMARLNCQPYPNVRLIKGGLWKSEAWLVVDDENVTSDSFRLREVAPETPNAVRGYTVEKLMRDAGFDTVDVLKLDIEGAEEQIFADPRREWLELIRVLVIETHGPGALKAVEEAFAARPFQRSTKGEKLVFTRDN